LVAWGQRDRDRLLVEFEHPAERRAVAPAENRTGDSDFADRRPDRGVTLHLPLRTEQVEPLVRLVGDRVTKTPRLGERVALGVDDFAHCVDRPAPAVDRLVAITNP